MSRAVAPDLLPPAQVADLFGVDPLTVTRWARARRLSSVRTIGNHRRYHPDEITALLAGTPLTPEQVAAMWERHRNGGGR